ncbi:hypothetical protein UP10_00975 [Bradyrhizobium sp. LTSPM299]|nr:hypothetical protein UP10_00975 [Bradyrhizobium sp. LTSPM299]
MIAEAGSGTKLSATQATASQTHPNFKLANMRTFSCLQQPRKQRAAIVGTYSSRNDEFWYRRKVQAAGTRVGMVCKHAERIRQESARFGNLIANDNYPLDPATNEVQLALVVARMIDTVKHTRSICEAVYDLARHKLREQFTSDDEKVTKRTQHALSRRVRTVPLQPGGAIIRSGIQPGRVRLQRYRPKRGAVEVRCATRQTFRRR